MKRRVCSRVYTIAGLAVLVCVLTTGGCRKEDPITFYKLEHRYEKDRQIKSLPIILLIPNQPPGLKQKANTQEWYRLAKENALVGKTIDEAIETYGENYVISLQFGREQPYMYYRLSGADATGIYGIVILDKKLRITKVSTDPEF